MSHTDIGAGKPQCLCGTFPDGTISRGPYRVVRVGIGRGPGTGEMSYTNTVKTQEVPTLHLLAQYARGRPADTLLNSLKFGASALTNRYAWTAALQLAA